MTRRKYTYKDVKRDFDKKNYELLTLEEEYKNVNQKLKYICRLHSDKGVQEITYAHIKEGKGCRYCGIEKSSLSNKLSDDHYKELAESKGFIFMGIKTINNRRYAELLCPEHRDKGIQFVQLSNLKRNKGCKYCSGNTKKSHEEFENEINNIFYGTVELLSKYKKQTEKVKCRCTIHDEMFYSYPNNLLKGYTGCKQCISDKRRNNNLKSHEDFVAQIEQINPHIKLLEKYKGANINYKCFCTLHNKEFMKYSYLLINGHTGCDECYKEDIRIRMGKTTEQFKEELKEVHPELEVVGEYINRYTPIKLKCKTHNYEFESAPCYILSKAGCCPKSIKYVKEKTIGDLLDKWNIKYTQQKTFEDCKDVKVLPFDYFLDDFNILIEYQGEQHYYPVKFGTQNIDEAKEKLGYTKKHDEIKKAYCFNNNIYLIEIPYWEYNDIETFLYNKLKKINVL